jgi:hypothetical protein
MSDRAQQVIYVLAVLVLLGAIGFGIFWEAP